MAVLLELSSALSVASVFPTNATKSDSNPATISVPTTIPVRGSLQVIVTLRVSESAQLRQRLTVLTTAQYFNTPTLTKKSFIGVVA